MATAFGDAERAAELRQAQVGVLPAISDCTIRRGRILEIGAAGSVCGDPLWNYQRLTAD